jgi:hypothetical protein
MSTLSDNPIAGATTGAVRLTLRVESLAILAALLFAYHQLHTSWGLFAALFLVPDLAMLPYLASRAAGAAAYNAAHNFIVPVAVAMAGVFGDSALVLAIATIWAAHIAFDRAVGYGLKYSTDFNNTHLGRVGRAPLAQ